MQAFIMRPFGMKEEIDFEKVEQLLIVPALEKAGVIGRTTKEIVRAGNIRVDMFQMILLADLVVADISIHNANVFYELGIRHALRSRHTFLLRAEARTPKPQPPIPFDLSTDRYMEYDPDRPADFLPALAAAILATVQSDEIDSPVFRSLPRLQEPPHEVLRPVPVAFGDDLRLAASKTQGGKLGLYASETVDLMWEVGGLRLAGRKQFDGRFFASARRTWERVIDIYPNDLEANLLLGTIYQRLDELELSDQCLDRVLANKNASVNERTEALALKARNAKVTGRMLLGQSAKKKAGALVGVQTAREARVLVLESGLLTKARDLYAAAFRENLNHYFSGINALSLTVLLLALIEEEKEAWAENFNSEEEAESAKSLLKAEKADLQVAVRLAIEAARVRAESKDDTWVELSGADYQFLIAEKDAVAANAYGRVLDSKPDFNVSSTRNQLELFRAFGLCESRILACLKRFGPEKDTQPLRQVIVFTGHMVDAADRLEPRFPAAAEGDARKIILAGVRERLNAYPGPALGIASGANGGDILFHEVCQELGVPTRVLLTLPENLFEERSVANAGPAWSERFYKLIESHSGKNEVQVLGSTDALPKWMNPASGVDVWQRTNVWLLEEAIAAGAERITLLALWNQEPGLSGGTQDFVEMADERGVAVKSLDARALLA